MDNGFEGGLPSPQVFRWWVLGGLALALQPGCASGVEGKPATAPTIEASTDPQVSVAELVSRAQQARDSRDFARALRLLSDAEERGAPRALRAELQLALGQYAELLALVQAQRATDPTGTWASEDERVLALLAARAAQELGRREEARARLLRLRGRPDSGLDLVSAEASLLLATQTLYEEGRRQGESELATLLTRLTTREFSSEAEGATYAVLAGRAAALLRQPELSNDHYNRAELQLGEASVDPLAALLRSRLRKALLRYRAELFIDKHDHAQAQVALVDLLKLAPADVEGRLLLARLLGEQSFDFSRAEDLAQEVLEDNPHHTGAVFLLGGIALRDMDLETARSWVERGLKTNSRDLDLLALDAAITFLAEQRDEFEAKIDRLEKLSPDNAQPLRIVAQFAEWEHRYPDIQRLMRKAARIDRADPHVRSLLGLTLVRAGSDAAGIVELNRAYQLDPYDVRVVNTLELYEGIVPERYTSVRHGPFRFRYPKDQVELLERYVPGLASKAWDQMRERYGYEPKAPIDVELYATAEHFGVRTAGVARVGIQGVCFGRKLATVTPEGSPANLGMTLWHELGHVFHLGLSDHRVPRYLTEGLAEWETKSLGRGWEREMDRELYQVREAGGEFRLSRLSRAFSHARHSRDMAAAYYASSLLAEFIAERFGEQKMVELLGQMGKPRLAREVVPSVLGQGWSELDQGWQLYLDETLGFLQRQFVPQLVRQPAAELARELKRRKLAKEAEGDLSLRLGLALLGEGSLEQARTQLAPLAERSPQARFALARIELAQGKPERASTHLQTLQAEGVHGASLSLLVARLALTRRDRAAAVEALQEALALEPRNEEVLATLAGLMRRSEPDTSRSTPVKTPAAAAPPTPTTPHTKPDSTEPRGGGLGAIEELSVLRRWARIAEHDPMPHRRLVQELLDRGQYEDAAEAADRLIWVDLAGMDSHRLAAVSFARAGQLRRADYEFDSALLCPADVLSLAQLGRSWKEELLRLGRRREAERAFEKIEARLAELSAQP